MSQFASVNQEACIACGACNSAAPDIFDLDYSGIAGVIYEGDKNRGITAIEQDLHEELQEAFDSCPTHCIQIAAIPFA
ncbi:MULTISPECIES: ferredoxin [Paenibacillus]|uniref:Ferredoxin n=1 Tax=Paenibacillus borealis TaxID=160799 RepID=A0ABX3H1L3_PAEBO|nr:MULTISPECIES: ferredoxin [Paenibacillus]AIQ17621.1 ferredoxin [Paenibacillus sp. FSL H7-0357]OMD43789.1 ferredoxin [Paenibacillus borealis]